MKLVFRAIVLSLLLAAPGVGLADQTTCTRVLSFVQAELLHDKMFPVSKRGELLRRYFRITPDGDLGTGVKEVGSGGQGEVYIGVSRLGGLPIALKIPSGEHIRDPARMKYLRKRNFFQQRVTRDIVAAGRPGSERVLLVKSGGTEEVPALLMPAVDGVPLSKTKLPPERIQHAAEQLAETLVAVHASGVVHADIKPENILGLPNGDIRLVDFGIAGMAGVVPERFMATADFLHPGYHDAKMPLNPARDVYGACLTIRELLDHSGNADRSIDELGLIERLGTVARGGLFFKTSEELHEALREIRLAPIAGRDWYQHYFFPKLKKAVDDDPSRRAFVSLWLKGDPALLRRLFNDPGSDPELQKALVKIAFGE